MTLKVDLMPTLEEEVAVAKQEAAVAQQQKERLAVKLRELGIDPHELS